MAATYSPRSPPAAAAGCRRCYNSSSTRRCTAAMTASSCTSKPARTFSGALGLDAVSLKQLGTDTELAINGSFNEGHRQSTTGDYAATFLDRLGGVAFWGSVSHHQSLGCAFCQSGIEPLVYFLRGLPLGDAVWFDASNNSGILYGDPLYSPVAVRLYPVNDTDTVSGGKVALYGSTVNGRDPAEVSTRYSVEVCPGADFRTCDQQVSWQSTGISGTGGVENMPLGNWDSTALTPGSYVLRLTVTSLDMASGRNQTIHDYYPVVVSAPITGDTDSDGLPDSQDNCIDVANADQRDTDGDGYGNRCDPDFNNDGIVGPYDLSVFKAVYGSTSAPDQDLNGDGIVGPYDLSAFKAYYGKSPGPSCKDLPNGCMPSNALLDPSIVTFTTAPSTPVSATDPVTDPALLNDPVPVTGPVADPATVSDAVTVTGSAADTVPASDPVPVTEPAPVSEPVSVNDPVTDPALVSDPVPVTGPVADPATVSDAVTVTGSAADTVPASDPVPVTEPAPVSEPVSVNDPAAEPLPVSDSAPVTEPAPDPGTISNTECLTTTITMSAQPNQTTWVINLMSSSDRADVDALAAKAESLNIMTVAEKVVVSGTQYWRLQVTGFSSLSEAKENAQMIKAALGLDNVWIFSQQTDVNPGTDSNCNTTTADPATVTEAPASESTPVALQTAEGPWVINLLSSIKLENVEQVAAKAASLGVETSIDQTTVRGRQIWRLQIIGFDSHASAAEYAKIVEQLLDINEVWIFKNR